MFILCTNKQVH